MGEEKYGRVCSEQGEGEGGLRIGLVVVKEGWEHGGDGVKEVIWPVEFT